MERKLATVLFVDIVDSSALVAGADPEVVRRRVQRFFDEVSHCVITHGGIVEKFAGDAVMAAFGIPRSHEDDAERAVRAAIAVTSAVEQVGARLGEVDAAPVPDQQRNTQLVLQTGQLRGQRRLGEVQPNGRTGHRPLLGDHHEVTELAQVHGSSYG